MPQRPLPSAATTLATVVCLLAASCDKPAHNTPPAPSATTAPLPLSSVAPADAIPPPDAGWGDPPTGFLRDAPFTMLLHADTPYRLMQGKHIDRETDVHLSLQRIQQGKVGAFAVALFVDGKYQKDGTAQYCRQATEKIDQVLKDHGDIVAAGLSVDDFERNWHAGRATVFRTIEGSWCFQRRVDAIDEYYARGVRMIGLTWQDDHDFATSWTDYSATGVTALGRKAVERMNRLGIAVDVSHMSDRAIDDVLSIARGPVFASHSDARGVCKHPRNLKDDHIRRIAATGGVIGVNLYPLHLRKDGRATLADVVAHLRYMRDLVGIEALGLGSDFDGIDRGPKGMETPAELPNLRKALQDAGFSASDIAAVFGGNFLRAMRVVEQQAKEPSAAAPAGSSP